jgi:hypothetical protein
VAPAEPQNDELQPADEAGAADATADQQQQEELPDLSPEQKRMLADAESGLAAANAKLAAADAAAATAGELV